MSKEQAIQTLQKLDGEFHRLAGDYNRQVRVMIMRAITGQKIPSAKCGIHAIEAAYSAATSNP